MAKQKFMREHDFDDDEYDYIEEKTSIKNKSIERRKQRAIRLRDVQLLTDYEDDYE